MRRKVSKELFSGVKRKDETATLEGYAPNRISDSLLRVSAKSTVSRQSPSFASKWDLHVRLRTSEMSPTG